MKKDKKINVRTLFYNSTIGIGGTRTMQNPKPGSKEAFEKGCTCPVLDNGFGRGHLGNGDKYGWVISQSCLLHGHYHELITLNEHITKENKHETEKLQ